MAAVTICSDFGAQNNKVCHSFHFFPISLLWSDRTRCHDLSFLNVEFYNKVVCIFKIMFYDSFENCFLQVHYFFFLYNVSDQVRWDQSLSRVRLFAIPWIAAHQASLSITTSRVHWDSHPLSQWCHPAILSSVGPFSSCPQSLPASESFSMSQLFAWGGQSTGVSALASFLPKKH